MAIKFRFYQRSLCEVAWKGTDETIAQCADTTKESLTFDLVHFKCLINDACRLFSETFSTPDKEAANEDECLQLDNYYNYV